MSNITPLFEDVTPKYKRENGNGGEPPMSDIEKRVGNVEKEIIRMEGKFDGRFDLIEERFKRVDERFNTMEEKISHCATKAELEGVKSSIIQWMVSTMLASASLAVLIGFGIARLVK